MDGGVSTSPQPLKPSQNPLLRRRNSIPQPVILPGSLSSSSSSSTSTSASASSSSYNSSGATSSASSGEFDMVPMKPVSYTSLRDILPSVAVNSPKTMSPAQNQVQSGSEITIRNRLVKQAAWAYLQPMSTSPDSSGRNFFRRLWDEFISNNPLASLFRFFNRHVFWRISRTFDWLLRAVRVRSSR